MFRLLWNLLQQHIDAWIGAIATILPTLGAFFYFVYQRIRLGEAGRKDRREVEKAKQKIQLAQTSDITIAGSLARTNNDNGEIDRSNLHRMYYVLAHHSMQIDKVIQVIQAYEGIQTLAPSSVIMAGIAFGVDPHKQRIGDVLVSKQLHGYELQRYGTACDGTPRIVARGDRVSASVKLLDRFRSGALDWSSRRGRWSRQVQFGTILSGETLVDNIDYRDQLRMLEPEAIGGEMEGVGPYAAAQNAKVDWILVKAICDWADGNKSGEKVAVSHSGKSKMKDVKYHYQRIAANNVARFIMHVLDKTRLV